MLFTEAIAPTTLELLRSIQALPFLNRTRLVGGTVLALQLGHRISVDLDVLGDWDDAPSLESELKKCGSLLQTGGNDAMQFFCHQWRKS